MEEKASSIVINIHGGNNQILPNATKAEQHFHYTQGKPEELAPEDPSSPWTPADEARLALYIDKEENVQSYIATLTACRTVAEVGEAVVRMCVNEPKVDETLIVKKAFIEVLLPFLTGLEKGKGIDNLRVYINKAWADHKKNSRGKGNIG